MHSMKENIRFDQALAPQILNNSDVTSAYFDLSRYNNIVLGCHAGGIAGGGAVAWTAYQDTTGVPSVSAKTISGKTAAHTDGDDNTLVTIEIAAAELDVALGFRYVAIMAHETGSQNAYVCASAVRANCRYPASSSDLPA